jgi:uncharacterized 2Fe-2S/4Fe-4S cluster protein (DUF4445 family)
VVTRKDINETQLAKAAVRVGVDFLLCEAEASHEEIEEFIVASAYGTYLDFASGDVSGSAAGAFQAGGQRGRCQANADFG